MDEFGINFMVILKEVGTSLVIECGAYVMVCQKIAISHIMSQCC